MTVRNDNIPGVQACRGVLPYIKLQVVLPKRVYFSATSVPEWVSFYCIFERSPWKGNIFIRKSLSGYHFSNNFASKSPKGYQFQRNLIPSPWRSWNLGGNPRPVMCQYKYPLLPVRIPRLRPYKGARGVVNTAYCSIFGPTVCLAWKVLWIHCRLSIRS